MSEFFLQFSPVTQAFIATLFTWGVTAAGASLVFFTKDLKPKLMDSLLGFAAGVMIAASFWSLLAPGIEMAEQLGHTPWLTAAIGFIGGGIFMLLTAILKFFAQINKAADAKDNANQNNLNTKLNSSNVV
mgnify:CR=1 FL=1